MSNLISQSNESLLMECVTYIEQKISSGFSYKEIVNGIEIDFHEKSGTIRNLFSMYTSCSLRKYIKRRLLTTAYMKMKNSRANIRCRDSYGAIKRYPIKFRNEFGVDIYGDYDENDLQPVMDISFLAELNRVFFRAPYIKDYELKADDVELDLDLKWLLILQASLASFFLPESMEDEFNKLTDDEKMLILYRETCKLNGVQAVLDAESGYTLLSLGKLIDFNKKNAISDKVFVFCAGMPEYLRETYDEIFDDIIGSIRSVIPESVPAERFSSVLATITNATSFSDITERIGINICDAKNLVWDYLDKGFVRFVWEEYNHE